MPTIKFEYTSNIKIDSKLKDFTNSIHNIMVEIINTDIDTCRTLITKYENFLVGNLTSKFDGFIQLEANILPGRSFEIKSKLGNALLEETRKLAHESNVSIDFRIKINETDTQMYFGLE